MTATITLYKECLVEQDKNFILDNNGVRAIETYLETLESSKILNFQYVKQGRSISIKINANQELLNMGIDSQDVNYCKIQNGNENPCYYFITDKNWRSENTIELVLSMDTLNTYTYDVDYTISDKTLVKRMHKDRFIAPDTVELTKTIAVPLAETGSLDFTAIDMAMSYPNNPTITIDPTPTSSQGSILYDADGHPYVHVEFLSSAFATYTVTLEYTPDALIEVIDPRSEEIVVPTYKMKEQTMYETISGARNDWSLYYKSNQNDENLVECFLVPEQPMSIKYQGSNSALTSGNVPSGKYLIFSATYPEGALTFKYGTTTYTLYAHQAGNVYIHNLLAVYNDSGTIKTYIASFGKSSNYTGGNWEQVYSGDIDILNAPQTVHSYEVASLPTAVQWFNNNLYEQSNATHTTTFSALINATILGHNSIDKTLAENIKIINVPYSPTPYNIDSNGVYTFESCWTYNSSDKQLKLNDFNAKWNNEIDSGVLSFMNPFIQNIHNINLSANLKRTFKDPKLHHSDYFRQKFVYDSFSKIFPLEKINYNASSKDVDFKFDFIMSRNIVSKFLFQFNQFTYTMSNEDYDKIVAVARNNEEVLYNSQYINYIRTGYNYDLKAKERTEVASGIGIGLNVASLVASIGLSFVPGGQAIGVAGGVASALGLAGQIVNYAKTTAQNEENIQRKLQEAQQQGTSVMNADDYDLLYAYSENKAKYCLYNASSQMQRILDDLFYYCGYTINEQMKPQTNTRRSFNYVQASLVINKTNNLSNAIVDDIKEKFEQGVTFLHYAFDKFDFEQNRENIEKNVL